MRLFLLFGLLVLPGMPQRAFALVPAPQSSNASQARHTRAHRRRRAPARRTQITPERAREIQQALVAKGYLRQASGIWDAPTQAAMRRYQADHHWQTHFVPDSRALIALGLGPR